MASAPQEDETEITGINVTPLVDIVLVLLIIFMVTANFIVRETVEADLPRAANGGQTVQGLLNVVIEKDGKVLCDGAEVNEAELTQRVSEALKKDKDTRAIINADQNLNYGRVVRIIDLIKGQGLGKLALAVQKAAPIPPAGN
jgi:biopolymer transport protein TolR